MNDVTPHILYMVRRIYYIFFLLALLLVVASCSKRTYGGDDIYGNNRPVKTEKHHTHKTDTEKTKPSAPVSIDEAWKNLDIKLSRGDNRELYAELKSWLGTPYKYAGMEKGVGTDCSGLTMQVYLKVYKKKIDRNSSRQFTQNCTKISREDLQEGDLVFFNNGQGGGINHVGIYLKEGYFVHASSSRGVMVNNLSQRYYNSHYYCGGRVTK